MSTLGTLWLHRLAIGSAQLRKPGLPLLTGGDNAWATFGIRDPSFLQTADGEVVVAEDGSVQMFFNARDKALDRGGTTCVGRASGSCETGWAINATPAFVDGRYAAQGSVLQLAPDHFRMYYSPDTLAGFALASSSDGRHWQRYGRRLILEPAPFSIRRMGLPFVRELDGQWVMLFEGIADGRFHLYLAISEEGVYWQPGNGGRPIYLPDSGNWDGFGQANPSLYVAPAGSGGRRLFILYNGCSQQDGWDIGVLFADSLCGPWQAAPAPILKRGAAGEYDGGRIEGARWVNLPTGAPTVAYFALPTTDSYAAGRIAFASLATVTDTLPAFAAAAETNLAAERAYNDGLARRYFDVWDRYPIQRFTNEVESRMLARVVPPGAKVLVLGSGGGRELPALLDRDCRVTAVDLSLAMLAIGSQRYAEAPIEWLQADVQDLPEHLADFDAAVCLGGVFNYLLDPAKFLACVKRCLGPDGSLILAVINAQHLSERDATALLKDGRVRALYSRLALNTLLRAANFTVASATGVRYLVDLLPAEWNSAPSKHPEGAAILDTLLRMEERLGGLLPPESGKFLLVHALVRTER